MRPRFKHLYRFEDTTVTPNIEMTQTQNIQCPFCREPIQVPLFPENISNERAAEFYKEQLIEFRDRLNTIIHIAEQQGARNPAEKEMRERLEELRRKVMGE
jgi:hypothetical protein